MSKREKKREKERENIGNNILAIFVYCYFYYYYYITIYNYIPIKIMKNKIYYKSNLFRCLFFFIHIYRDLLNLQYYNLDD